MPILTTEHLCSMFSLPRELPVLASTSSCTTPYVPYSYKYLKTELKQKIMVVDSCTYSSVLFEKTV